VTELSSEGEEHALKREVGWYGSFAMGYADVGADLYVAIGLVAFYAAGASPIAFAIASITYVCTGLAYAELATAYPYAGGAHVYSMKAFNDITGFVAGWAVMLDYTVDIALFSLASAGYLSFYLPWMKNSHFLLSIFGYQLKISYIGITAFLLVIALLFLNSVGIRESSKFNELLVSIDLVVESSILIIGILFAFGLALFLSQVTDFGATSIFSNIVYIMPQYGTQTQNFIYGITLAMTSFIGIESIAQAAEETKRPQRWIPRANKLSIIAVVIFAVGLSTLSMGLMPWQDLAAAQTDPMAAIASRVPHIGHLLAPIVALTGFTICYVSTNTGVIGASRVVFSMGRFSLMPSWFYKVHKRFRTPIRTIAVFGLIGAGMALLGELHFVADLYNFGALLSYVIVNVSLIVLRNKEPDAYRAWKLPGTLKIHIGAKTIFIPVVSVIGAIATGTMWTLVI
jgi:APA family basic amino acid/polyamine antiporter